MKKAIATIAAVGFLGSTFVTVTPVPASAFVQLFFVPVLMAKEDKNFKAVNPYAKPVRAHHKSTKKKI